MNALDTNILVRFLVRDDKKQAQLVYTRFKQAEAAGECLLVPLLVVLETIWVLESVYDLSRSDILSAIEDLIHMPILEFEADEIILSFLSHGKDTKLELSDLLIACSAQATGSDTVLTFDKKAARHPFFQLLK